MFLWLLFQQFDSDSGQSRSKLSKVLWSFILSYVHNIAYINVDKEADTKVKVAIFYAVTLVENVLLVSLWMTSYGASLEFEPEQVRQRVQKLFADCFTKVLYGKKKLEVHISEN